MANNGGGEGPGPGRSAPLSNDPVVVVPPEVLAKYKARVLDPSTAVKVAGQGEVRSTLYLSDKLIVGGAANEDTRQALTQAAESKGLVLVPPIVHQRRREQLTSHARGLGRDDADTLFHTVVHLQPAEGAAV